MSEKLKRRSNLSDGAQVSGAFWVTLGAAERAQHAGIFVGCRYAAVALRQPHFVFPTFVATKIYEEPQKLSIALLMGGKDFTTAGAIGYWANHLLNNGLF